VPFPRFFVARFMHLFCVSDFVQMNLQEEEGWWEGNLNGKIGVFPSNFVEVMEAEEADKHSNEFFLTFFCGGYGE